MKMASELAKLVAVAIAASSLAACGGGGGGGVASLPPAPPAPTNPPSIPAATIGTPTIASVPNASTFPQATPGGPTMQTQTQTEFPLVQTVLSFDIEGRVAADTATTNGGTTLAIDSSWGVYGIDVGNPALGISDGALTEDWCGYCAQIGAYGVDVRIASPATSNLSWTTYGSWVAHNTSGSNPSSVRAVFVTGYRTPVASVPTIGSASYAGVVAGTAYRSEAGLGYAPSALSGTAVLSADFDTGSITGALTNMVATVGETSLPWNSVSLQGSIAGGQFTGSTAATSAPGNVASLGASATGTVAGIFFGPSAEELGAVWTLSDGLGAAVGTIGASTAAAADACSTCWDY